MSETCRKKHAYLIIAHNNFGQLQQLIDLLDDERNDIYLHIDKKAKDFQLENLRTIHSRVSVVNRISVTWGGHSQIQSEMELLKESGKKHYQYYHLLSGADLPLKTQDVIHEYFNREPKKNYISYDDDSVRESYYYRTEYYYMLRNFIGRKQDLATKILVRLENLSLKLQKSIRIKRKQIVPFYKGANWFSITDDMVQYLLCNQDIIKKQFYYSFCGDEVFLHSLAMASPYSDTIVRDALRATDWNRGTPYVYRKEDVPELLKSEKLFGRKFDIAVDSEAINMIAENVRK